MSVYFSRLKVGYPDQLKAPEDWEGSWRIYTVLTSTDKRSCTTLADVQALGANDKQDARTSYVSFTNKAQTGLNLCELYDEKQCHEAHSFKLHPHDSAEVKIHRIWGTGAIRIYFLYFSGKRIIILKTAEKRKDTLSKGEKQQLENIAKVILNCLSANTFESREI